MKGFRQLVELPDYVTLLSSASGMLSIIFSVNGEFTAAAWFLLAALMFDRLDGYVARRINRREKTFGREIDSLSDCLAFGAAPAVFGYCLGMKDLFSVMVIMFFVSAVILRLARYNVQTTDPGYYHGMNVAYNGLLFPLVYFIRLVMPFDPSIIVLLYLLAGILMLSSIKWKKI